MEKKHLGSFAKKDDAIKCRTDFEKLIGFHENHGKRVARV